MSDASCIICREEIRHGSANGYPWNEVHTAKVSPLCWDEYRRAGFYSFRNPDSEWCLNVRPGDVIVHLGFRYRVTTNRGQDYSRSSEPWEFDVEPLPPLSPHAERLYWYGSIVTLDRTEVSAL